MIYNEKWHSNNIGILYYTRLEQLTMTNNKIRDMYMGYHHNVTVCEIDIVNSIRQRDLCDLVLGVLLRVV